MVKILLIDDSYDTGLLVKNSLDPYTIHQVETIAEAEEDLRKNQYDLILIDVRLPDGNGFDLCLKLSKNKRFQNLPKVLLTGMDQTSEKVFGFNCGADDYVTKPFSPMELKARVDRYLKKKTHSLEANFSIEEFEFDLEFQRCFVHKGEDKRDLQLTPREFKLFLHLARNAGHVMSRKQLEKTLWESDGTVIEIRGVDVHVAHLRKKLGERRDIIASVYGQGYAFQVLKKAA